MPELGSCVYAGYVGDAARVQEPHAGVERLTDRTPSAQACAASTGTAPCDACWRETASKWLGRAEKLAELPKLTRGAFHAFRRLWASERKHLPDEDVAAAGGWTDPATMKGCGFSKF